MGADVVAPGTVCRDVQELARFRGEFEALAPHVARVHHHAWFDPSPETSPPQHRDHGANALVDGIPRSGDAGAWKRINGKRCIFGGQASPDAFAPDEARLTALADRHCQAETHGRNRFLQRAGRLAFRVPPLQNGEELTQAMAGATGRR
jgi:hypothetical protein